MHLGVAGIFRWRTVMAAYRPRCDDRLTATIEVCANYLMIGLVVVAIGVSWGEVLNSDVTGLR